MKIPNLKLIYNNQSNNLDVILHGSSQGMDSNLIYKIIEESKKQGNSVVAFNFPFFERGEENSSGPKLTEEIKSLETVLKFCKSDKYESIRLIGKSLGGCVAGEYLNKKINHTSSKFSLIIFGYDIGYINIKQFSGNVTIVQGSKDKFGDINDVKNDLQGSIAKKITYLSIVGADHSYRVPETKEPVFEDEAVRAAFALKT